MQVHELGDNNRFAVKLNVCAWNTFHRQTQHLARISLYFITFAQKKLVSTVLLLLLLLFFIVIIIINVRQYLLFIEYATNAAQ